METSICQQELTLCSSAQPGSQLRTVECAGKGDKFRTHLFVSEDRIPARVAPLVQSECSFVLVQLQTITFMWISRCFYDNATGPIKNHAPPTLGRRGCCRLSEAEFLNFPDPIQRR